MTALSAIGGDVAPPVQGPRTTAAAASAAERRPVELPAALSQSVWRADQLGSSVTTTVPSGFAALDRELPGGGWPCHALTEILQAQPTVAEWRLLAPALRPLMADGRTVVAVGPPKTPHLPGLRRIGLDERRLVWIQAETPAERLWATEQLVKAGAAGALIAWLPQARQEQIRRLQVCAQACEGPVFLCRPIAAMHEPSAAPLRLQLRFGIDWQLHLQILKRKGPVHDGIISLPSVPGGLEAILTPRLERPSGLIATRGPAPVPVPVLPVTSHALVGPPAGHAAAVH